MRILMGVIAAASLAIGSSVPAAAQEEMDAQSQRVIGGVIDALVGNHYNVSDRQAIRRCAIAAVDRAEQQNRGDFRTQPVAYPGYRGRVRVTAITDVQRRLLVVRIRGLLSTARHGYGQGNRGADLTFRCDVNGHGNVGNVKIERNPSWRPRPR
ncbi:MAG TPA: hypothetical protein VHS33_08670 [Sphingomicrobium sp.]|nr:hypothetical protein [Sphingomicrobium sp.]